MESTAEKKYDGHLLELKPEEIWSSAGSRKKGLLVAINTPGYYSLPVRLLSLRAMSQPALRSRFDFRYIEWDNPQYSKDHTPELEELILIIHHVKPDVLGFSMNIWNRNACVRVARHIKSHLPQTCILVGGQEVTHSVADYLHQVPEFDYLIDGEGEEPFIEFLLDLDLKTNRLANPGNVSGLRYRHGDGTAYSGPAHLLSRLDETPSVILAGMVPVNQKDRLGVLLESSRGCPFHCAFCFEGAKREKLRIASIDRLCREAEYMAARGARYFHVMDPILCNSNTERLASLCAQFKTLKSKYGHLAISVETYADQITDEVAVHLKEFTMLDIGLQSTHPPTLAAIHRKMDFERFSSGIERIKKFGPTINIFLIAGLPFETAASFLGGLFFAMECRPTQIFLNELLLLNGTELRKRAEEFGYAFDPQPPYTVFSTKWMSKLELAVLKMMNAHIEHRYNLNNCNFATPTPWRPTINGMDTDYRRVVLGGPCKQNCPGCTLSTIQGLRNGTDGIASIVAQAFNADIELICGDGISIQTLVHTVAQFKLAGALRIKLTAPYSLFAGKNVAEQLIQAGIYFFSTFCCAQTEQDRAAFEGCMGYFKQIRHKGMLVNGRKVEPHVEIALSGSRLSLHDHLNLSIRLGTHHANAVCIATPNFFCDLTHEVLLESEIEALISAALRHRFAIRGPSAFMEALFAQSDDRKAIMASLERLNMVSKGCARPCRIPAEENIVESESKA